MAYYTTDLKKRVLKYESTHTVKETSEVFGVGVRTIFKWKKKLKETGNLERAPLHRKWRKLDPEKLIKYVEEHPDAYEKEMASEFKVSKSCIGKALRKRKVTRKKKLGATGKGTRKNVRSMRGQYPATKKRR
jgi:transposase